MRLEAGGDFARDKGSVVVGACDSVVSRRTPIACAAVGKGVVARAVHSLAASVAKEGLPVGWCAVNGRPEPYLEP